MIDKSTVSKRPSNEKAELQTLMCHSASVWESWLNENHAIASGVWLKFAKKSSGIPSVCYADALDVALCFGWIDGQVRAVDKSFYMQRFTPRRKRSKWSKINCGHAERLIKDGRMRAAGLKQVELAKADGRWEAAYVSSRTASVPDDLKRALQKASKARKMFESLDSQNRYAILYRIQNAKRADTRSRWIDRIVTMLAAGRKFHA